jgi:hypothetical protein
MRSSTYVNTRNPGQLSHSRSASAGWLALRATWAGVFEGGLERPFAIWISGKGSGRGQPGARHEPPGARGLPQRVHEPGAQSGPARFQMQGDAGHGRLRDRSGPGICHGEGDRTPAVTAVRGRPL